MRILFIANYSQLYGANRSMLTIIEYLHNNEYDEIGRASCRERV